MVVTEDKNIRIQKASSNGSFIEDPIKVEMKDSFSKIVLVPNSDGSVQSFMTLSPDKKDLCIYKFNNGMENPNPIQKMSCNHTSDSYLDLAYESFDAVAATGNSKNLILFSVINNTLNYLT